jgi:D-alanyl-D-alanine dipeptidase
MRSFLPLMLYVVLFSVWSCKEAPRPPIIPVTMVDTLPMELETDYDTVQWQELTELDSFILDIRYATTNNFVKEKIYPCARCFLKPKVAHALIEVNRSLFLQGYKLKLFDCYRPSPAQQILWNKVPDSLYVAPPAKGSMHSRGMTLDLTLTDLQGNEIDMGTPYDFFGPEAHPDYTKFPPSIVKHRRILSEAMRIGGFQPITTEWWHFTYGKGFPPLEDWEWICP